MSEAKFTSMADAVSEFEKNFEAQKEDDLFSTGFEAHDKALGRLRKGSLTLVAHGRPRGKQHSYFHGP
jgi:hypothetical protein